MLDPQDLLEFDPSQPAEGELPTPVLVYALSGFVDAGQACRLATDQLLADLDHRVVARFDVDQLYDYRGRRPTMTFGGDRWETYDRPHLELHLVRDVRGTAFLFLTGPEPDLQWERFVRAVEHVVLQYGVRLTVGLTAIPMGVPHTRPVGITAHASRPELVEGRPSWVGRVQVPGNASGLLELRLGEAGYPAAGFAVHVPHYLAATAWPAAAHELLTAVGQLAELDLPVGSLAAAAAEAAAAVSSQIADQPEVAAVVGALEEQYDAFVAGQGRSLLDGKLSQLPTADELGAELERFLAEENERRGGDS